jgi:hypothetical protein
MSWDIVYGLLAIMSVLSTPSAPPAANSLPACQVELVHIMPADRWVCPAGG